MKKDMIRKILALAAMIGLMIILTGCEDRKCIKSHTESSVCTYSMYNGKTVVPVVMPCTVTVCDEYEKVEE